MLLLQPLCPLPLRLLLLLLPIRFYPTRLHPLLLLLPQLLIFRLLLLLTRPLLGQKMEPELKPRSWRSQDVSSIQSKNNQSGQGIFNIGMDASTSHDAQLNMNKMLLDTSLEIPDGMDLSANLSGNDLSGSS